MNAPQTSYVAPQRWPAIFAFRAPYLERKLMRQRIVRSVEEANALFTELKRYLLVLSNDPSRTYPLTSLRIDEVWHQFVLFTFEYTRFCEEHFGRYLHHCPSGAPNLAAASPPREATLDELAARYTEMFGAELPASAWRDVESIGPNRRMLRNPVGELGVRIVDDRAELVARTPAPRVLLRADAWAARALDFVARHGAFFVRELPALADEDRVVLTRALHDARVVRVGP